MLTGTQHKGLKISEMSKAGDINKKDIFPIVQGDHNKHISVESFRDTLNIPKLTSSIDLNDDTVAASARAAFRLHEKISILRNELSNELSKLDKEIADLEEGFSEYTPKWDDIEGKPDFEDLVGKEGPIGPMGPEGKEGKQGIQGLTGEKGKDGKDGKDGNDGINGPSGDSNFFHIKYSINPNGNPMSNSVKEYIGIAVTNNRVAPSLPSAYSWSKFEGRDGETGIPGKDGEDGETTYWHVRYGTGYDENGSMVFTENNGSTPGDWLGQYTSSEKESSSSPDTYTWSFLRGESGEDGPVGKNGPIATYRGVYDSTKTYRGTEHFVDIVKWNNGESDFFYIIKETVGEIIDIDPSNELYWSAFSSNYTNIATEFIFAEGANLAGWQFFVDENGNETLRSQNGSTILNGTTGEIEAANGLFKVNRDGSGQLGNNALYWDKEKIWLNPNQEMGYVIQIGDPNSNDPIYNNVGKINNFGISFQEDTNPLTNKSYDSIFGSQNLRVSHKFKDGQEIKSTVFQVAPGAFQSGELMFNLVNLPKTKALAETIGVGGTVYVENGFLKIAENLNQ